MLPLREHVIELNFVRSQSHTSGQCKHSRKPSSLAATMEFRHRSPTCCLGAVFCPLRCIHEASYRHADDSPEEGSVSSARMPSAHSMCAQPFTLHLLLAALLVYTTSSSASLPGCVAIYNLHGIPCIAVTDLSGPACDQLAQSRGTTAPHVSASSPSGAACYVSYTLTCQQAINVLQQQGDGLFTVCDTATSQSAAQAISRAIDNGSSSSPSSGDLDQYYL